MSHLKWDNLKLDVASDSLAGPHRRTNEDSVLAKAPVFIVADGMGGHDAGDLASALVVEQLAKLPTDPTIEGVQEVFHQTRSLIDALPGRRGQYAAGTTVSGVILIDQGGQPYWLVINLGDSRTYRLTDGQVTQVSVDHSEVQAMIDAGQLTPEGARSHQRRNVVTRILGAGTDEVPDYWLIPVAAKERWMVCSDGVTAELPQTVIESIVAAGDSPTNTVTALVTSALAAGGHDNISVIVLDSRREDEEITAPTWEASAPSWSQTV
ncbi:MAG: serine/threonine-protein phosphatase [Propionibacteriaceae bacterium]|jgi:protein phosphatase|nr:serine/threonine-protein phosphatase [Propionibacteriaceae bacterium]